MGLKSLTNLLHKVSKGVKSCTKQPHRLSVFVLSPNTNLHRTQSARCMSTDKNVHYEEATPGWQRVYHGALAPQIRAVKWFSLSSSIIGVVSQPFLYKEIVSLGSIPVAVAAYSFIGFFTILTPVLLHLITKKYVTSLDYNAETQLYSAKTYTFLCMLRETKFKPEDVTVPDVPGMFTSVIAKGVPLFLDPRMFKHPEHYAKIMGYDKPIDFKLYETEANDKKK